MTRILRFVIFSPSIISDIGNPQATTVRAMCQALIALGHDVTHIEPRANGHLTRLLKTRGYAPMRALNERYPLLRYKQYDPAGGIARRIWFSREIGTADAVIAYPGCNDDVVSEVTELDSHRIVTFQAEQESLPAEMRDAWFAPAVFPQSGDGVRSIDLTLAYDQAVASDSGTNLITSGVFSGNGWDYVAEVNLPERYQSATRVRMNREDVVGDAYARALLPVANDAIVELVDDQGDSVEVISELPAVNDAEARSAALIAFIDDALGQRYVLPT